MNPIDFLNSPVTNALGWTLLHALWQGFASVLPTAIVLHLLRSRSSALRYRIGVLALLGQLLASVATFVVYYQPAQVYASVRVVETIRQPLSVGWPMLPQTLPWHQQVQQFLESHLSQFVFVYLIGLVIFGLRLAGGWLYLHRLSQTAVQPATRALIILTEQLRVALSLRAEVQVRESARIAVPMVLGALKPVLLVPVSLVAGLSLSEMEAVLAHELAHVKRHDYAVNLLQSVMDVLYFFHPALWWLSERVREEREHCCDDLAVLACGGNGRILAQALARVEELRTNDNTQTPALAMALTSNRQLLLHRVRRMLGISTRPMVSNGGLAGITVATLLLVSVSVYAVQQEPPKQPKPRVTQPKPTRRHTVNGNSEYGMAGNKKVSYIIWKGRKLPDSRVTTLQRQLDRVMAGQLSLDAVKQPNRDILMTIIEKNNSFDSGMSALTDGLSHIDYNNIVASAMKNVPVNLTIPVVDMADSATVSGQRVRSPKLYQSRNDANLSDTSRLSAAQRELETLTRKMQEVMTERQPIIDRLSKEITELTLNNSDWQQMTDKLVRQQSVLAKQQGALAKQQSALAQKLAPLHTEIASLSLQKTVKADQLIKQKQLQSDLLEKKMNQLGSRMGELGSQMGELGSQMQPLEAKLEPRQQRVGILADSISKLVEPASELSERIGKLSNQIAEEAIGQAEKAMQQAEAAMRLVENVNVNISVPPARPARAPRPPKAVRGTVKPPPAVAPQEPMIETEYDLRHAPRIPKALRGTVIPPKPAAPARPKVSATPPITSPAPKPTPAVSPIPPK